MKLILVRHGETEENRMHIMQGHLPGKLSQEGIEQAQKLAIRLSNEKIDIAYSSDLARAKDTAALIMKHHPSSKLILTEDLREINLGSFTGKDKHLVDWSNRPADIESIENMQTRASRVLELAFKTNKGSTVLFVGHNAINKALIGVITGKTGREIESIENLKNTAVCIFEIKDERPHLIKLMNCISHLI